MSNTYTPTTGSGGGGGTAAADAANPFSVSAPFDVNTGRTVSDNTFAPGTARRVDTTSEVTQNAADYMQHALDNKTPAEIKELQKQLAKAGYAVPATGLVDSATVSAYEQMLADAHLANLTGDPVSPEEYLAKKAADGGATPASAYTGPSTTTSTSTDLSTPGDARSVAESVFQQYIGRDPKGHAVAALHAALNAYESANPSHTTTTSDPHGHNTTVTSQTSGGVSAEDRQNIAEDQLVTHHGKELAKVQIDRLAQVFSSMLSGA